MPQRYSLKTSPPNINSNSISTLYKSYDRTKDSLIPIPTFNRPTWSRPFDWLPITAPTAAEQKVIMLVRINSTDVNYLSFLCRGAYTVDWGDGVVENIADNTQANHEYSFSSISNSTLTSEGFKQVIVTITPQGGNNLTVLNFQARHPKLAAGIAYAYLVLEMYVSAPNLAASSSFVLTTTTTTTGLWNVFYLNIVSLGGLTSYSTLFQSLRQLKKIDLNITSSCTSVASLFTSCTSLQEVNITAITSNITATNSMFNGCTSLVTAPLFNTQNVTDMSQMFSTCRNLINVPLYNTSKVTNFYRMFLNCVALKTVPLFDVTAATTTLASNGFQEVFFGCSSLETVPLFNTRNAGNMSGLFTNCIALKTVPQFDTRNVVNISSMFSGCYSIQNVPFFNTSKVTNFYRMFLNCYALKTVPLFDVTAATTTAVSNGLQEVFYNCHSLENVPLFNTANAGNLTGMFLGCRSLKTVPLFNTRNALTTTSMFQDCQSLVEVPQFDLLNSRDVSNMFNGCYNLCNVGITSLPSITATGSVAGAYLMFNGCENLKSVNIQMPIVGNINGMFTGCASLSSVPLNFNSLSGTVSTQIFQNCYSITSIPSSFRTDLVTDLTNTFSNCTNLVSLPPLNVSRVTIYTTTFNGCVSLETAPLSTIIANISFASCKLGISAIETVYDGLTANPSAARTITVTSNPGTVTYSIASVTTTAGSISATTSTSTAGLSAGMYVTGTGTSLTTGRAVTFTDAGDLVNLAAHGLSNNDIVAFSVITTTTGITRYTSYYVVNATTDTFQVSDTLGGPAKALTTDGTGTVIYASQITSIVTGTPNTIILSRKQASTAINTLTFRQSNVSKAILKGWTVTGG